MESGAKNDSVPPAPSAANKLSDDDAERTEQNGVLSAHSLRTLCLPVLAYAGGQLAWATQVGHFTAHLRKLGLSDRLVALAWLGGPISGIVVHPLVGALSDRCTSRLGRRRPFMLAGSALVAATLTLFAWSGTIAAALGDPVSGRGGGSRTALAIALAAFWLLDLSINVLQSPTRALLADTAPAAHLPAGNALFAFSNGAGKALGYAFGAYGRDIRVINGLAAGCVLLLSFAPTALLSELPAESPPATSQEQKPRTLCGTLANGAREMAAALRAMPRAIRRAFAVQWLTYLSLALMFIYLSDFAGGAEVFGGNADAPPASSAHHRFIEGVAFANKALLIMSLLSMCVAPAVPSLARAVGARVLWGGSLVSMGVILLCAPLRPGPGGVFLIAMSIAMPLAVAFSLPWAIATLALSGPLADKRGLYLATLNLSSATPGLFASIFGGLLVHAGGGRLSVPLAFAGGVAILAALATIRVDVPKELVGGEAREVSKKKTVVPSKCAGCFPPSTGSVASKDSVEMRTERDGS